MLTQPMHEVRVRQRTAARREAVGNAVPFVTIDREHASAVSDQGFVRVITKQHPGESARGRGLPAKSRLRHRRFHALRELEKHARARVLKARRDECLGKTNSRSGGISTGEVIFVNSRERCCQRQNDPNQAQPPLRLLQVIDKTK